MAITYEQAVPGTKIKIPAKPLFDKVENWALIYKARWQSSPFLIITGRKYLYALATLPDFHENEVFFDMQDIELYEEPDTVGELAPGEYRVYENPIKPSHYNDTSITALQVIDSWDVNFYIGNVLKYLARYKKKGDPIGDLGKAMEYLEIELGRLIRADESQ